MSALKHAAFFSVLVVCATTVRSEESIGFDLSADFFGKYVWRGQNLNNSTVFQPGIGITYGGLTGSIWGSLDMTNTNGQKGEFTEYDFGVDYTAVVPEIEGVEFSIGTIYYRFPSVTPSGTTEVYWGFGFDLPLNPSVTVYHDVDEAKGIYVEFGLGHSFDDVFTLLPDVPVGVELDASIGWGDSDYNDFYWGLKGSRLNDLTLSLALPMDGGGWTVAPSINYVTLLSDGLRATDAYAQKSDYVFMGIGLSKSF